jgi:O-antigen/teichoic acid export membrane protein
LAVTDAQPATVPSTGVIVRLRSSLAGSSEASVTKRLAGTIFINRTISAALAYLLQILLARWMGGPDYGVYVYVWTWALLLGSMMDFGISASAQKNHSGNSAPAANTLLRGFLSGSRWVTFIPSAAVSLLMAVVVKLLSPQARLSRSASAVSRYRPSWSPIPRTASRAHYWISVRIDAAVSACR